jgi:hypothetical protein
VLAQDQKLLKISNPFHAQPKDTTECSTKNRLTKMEHSNNIAVQMQWVSQFEQSNRGS